MATKSFATAWVVHPEPREKPRSLARSLHYLFFFQTCAGERRIVKEDALVEEGDPASSLPTTSKAPYQ